MRAYFSFFVMLFVLSITACTSIKETEAIKNKGFKKSAMPVDSIMALIPDYSHRLSTVKGKGKAIISEPGNSNRATLYFSSNQQKSLVTAKNSIGIEGGKLLTDGDTLLVYNKVDNYARKISVRNGQLTNIDHLASINLLHILAMPVSRNEVTGVLENNHSYLLQLQSGAKIYVDKKTHLIRQVDQPPYSVLPYSRIIYDAYKQINQLTLPRRITIFSADKSSKIDLLIQSLEVNPALEPLTIELPDDIKIYRQ